MEVRFTLNGKTKPPLYKRIPSGRKVADAELVFHQSDGLLAGYVLSGFTVWTNSKNKDGYSVAPPNWQFNRDGEWISLPHFVYNDDSKGDEMRGLRMVGPLKMSIIELFKAWLEGQGK